MTYNPCVYFARRAAAVKIGFTGNVDARVASLKTELLGTLYGDMAVERAIHAHFADLSLGGEWFIDHPAIRSFIADHGRPATDDWLTGSTQIELAAAAEATGVPTDTLMQWVDGGLPCYFTPMKRTPRVSVRDVRLFRLHRELRMAASHRDASLDCLFGLVAP